MRRMVNSQVQPAGNSVICHDKSLAEHVQSWGRFARSFLEVLTEAQSIAVAVLDIEVTATVRLVGYLAGDGDSLAPELGMQRIRVVDPDVSIPGLSLGIHAAVRASDALDLQLAEHDDHTLAPDHAKAGRLAPEAIEAEAEFVPIVIRAGHYIVYDKIRRDAPVPGFRR